MHIDESVAREVIAEVILAIEHLHSQGITYRDLKPQNVLFDSDHHVRLSDFGLRNIYQLTTMEEIQKARFFEYKAPEVIMQHEYGKSLDWYLVGALLFEMVVGKTPFYSEQNDQMMQSILVSPLTFPASLSDDVINLIQKLMQRDPAKRLGADNADAMSVKAHPFFNDTDWESVEKKNKAL